MTGNKRQRELARAKYERQQARRSTASARHKRQQRIIAAAVVAVLVVGTLVWVVVGRQSGDTTAATPSATPSPAASAFPSASSSPGSTAAPVALDCTAPGTPRADDKSYATAPADGTGASITLTTNCGDIVIAVDPAAAPATVASELFLAADGFYDNTTCHRLTTQGLYVLQCGDPAGNGSGGPGYTVPDENLPTAGSNNYPAGTVAMANGGPGTSGSQFFIVYQDTTLPGDYSIWGTVTSGLDMVQAVAAAGVVGGGTDGAPQQPVFIETATVQPK